MLLFDDTLQTMMAQLQHDHDYNIGASVFMSIDNGSEELMMCLDGYCDG